MFRLPVLHHCSGASLREQPKGLSLRGTWRYHVPVHSVAERLLFHLRREALLNAGERVGVAVSGGIDSVALLRLLLELRGELGIVLSAVHFNHKLRAAESETDQEFVATLAREYQLEFHCDAAEVAHRAAEEHVSIEAAGRDLRYGFFRELLGEARIHTDAEAKIPASGKSSHSRGIPPPLALNKILTAHTLDDQAETVLLRLIRGAGLRGLAAIHPRIPVEDDDGNFRGEIIRPLLTARRRDLEHYLKDIGQTWREDATNASTKFARNRLRKLVVPLLEKEFNPAIAETLSELADIARAEEDFWDNEVAGWMGTGVHWSEPSWAQASNLVQIAVASAGSSAPAISEAGSLDSKIANAPWLVMNASVDRLWFLGEPLAVQRRVIKAIGEQAGLPLQFKHVEEVVRFAAQERAPRGEIALPYGWKVTRDHRQILFLTPDLRGPAPVRDYEYELPVPGEIDICEIGTAIEARRVSNDAGYNPEHLLDGDALPPAVKVRNWRAGDRFWPNHTKTPRKVKELLQERRVPHEERKSWPVVVHGDQILWMRGFSPPAHFAAKSGRAAIAILERPLAFQK